MLSVGYNYGMQGGVGASVLQPTVVYTVIQSSNAVRHARIILPAIRAAAKPAAAPAKASPMIPQQGKGVTGAVKAAATVAAGVAYSAWQATGSAAKTAWSQPYVQKPAITCGVYVGGDAATLRVISLFGGEVDGITWAVAARDCEMGAAVGLMDAVGLPGSSKGVDMMVTGVSFYLLVGAPVPPI